MTTALTPTGASVGLSPNHPASAYGGFGAFVLPGLDPSAP